jgi:putative transposase
MTNVTTKSESLESATATAVHLFDNWFDPIESGVRERVRDFIEELIRCELDAALCRPRYGRAKHGDSGLASIVGHRHGSRPRSLTGSFGKNEITVPRARLAEPVVRLILDGTVVRVRLDRKATSISLLVVIGVREDGQKVLLAVKHMGSESAEAWRTVLDDLIARGLRRPEFLIVDGAPGLDKAIAAVWHGVPVQRCTVHKHRNLLAHAPERLHEEIGADYTDMIYAATPEDIAARRKAFIRKWRLKHRPVADSLEEAGDRLFTFAQLPPSQWRSARTTNAIERLHEEFKRRIKTQTVLPSAETAAMLFWALLASGQINMRKVDGWQTLATRTTDQPIDLAA